jgi:hypothetical protein
MRPRFTVYRSPDYPLGHTEPLSQSALRNRPSKAANFANVIVRQLRLTILRADMPFAE